MRIKVTCEQHDVPLERTGRAFFIPDTNEDGEPTGKLNFTLAAFGCPQYLAATSSRYAKNGRIWVQAWVNQDWKKTKDYV